MCGTFKSAPIGKPPHAAPPSQPEARRVAILFAALGEELHADADAEERLAAAADFFFQHVDEAGGAQVGRTLPERADAGEHEVRSRRGDLRRARVTCGSSPIASSALATERRLPMP